jgi:hypothetical protein
MLNNIAALYDAGAPPAVGDFESIQTYTVGAGGSASITFSSIPSTYKHLQLRILSRSARTDAADGISLRLNSDTGTNYSWHYLRGDGSSAGSGGSATQAEILLSYDFAANNAGSSIFGFGIVDILDYANTNKYKTVRTLAGNDRNGSGAVGLTSGSWRNTAATTTLTLASYWGANNFLEYSSFALYGVK